MANATISTNARGRPEIGPDIPIFHKGVVTRKPRVVVGWSHQNDTPNGLESGRVWGWVSEGNHFQVYDENFNRSKRAGEVVFCGVANFTMVRMFHPYWAHFGRPPRDMHSKDKERCRYKYRQLMRQFRIDNNMPVDDDPTNPIQPNNTGSNNRGRSRPSRRSRAGKASAPRRRRPPVIAESDSSSSEVDINEPLAISDSDEEEARPLSTETEDINKSAVSRTQVFPEKEPKQERESTFGSTRPSPVSIRPRSIFTPSLNNRETSVNSGRNPDQSGSDPPIARRSVSSGLFIRDDSLQTRENGLVNDQNDAATSTSNTHITEGNATTTSTSNEIDVPYPPLPELGDDIKDEDDAVFGESIELSGSWPEVIVIDD